MSLYRGLTGQTGPRKPKLRRWQRYLYAWDSGSLEAPTTAMERGRKSCDRGIRCAGEFTVLDRDMPGRVSDSSALVNIVVLFLLRPLQIPRRVALGWAGILLDGLLRGKRLLIHRIEEGLPQRSEVSFRGVRRNGAAGTEHEAAAQGQAEGFPYLSEHLLRGAFGD